MVTNNRSLLKRIRWFMLYIANGLLDLEEDVSRIMVVLGDFLAHF